MEYWRDEKIVNYYLLIIVDGGNRHQKKGGRKEEEEGKRSKGSQSDDGYIKLNQALSLMLLLKLFPFSLILKYRLEKHSFILLLFDNKINDFKFCYPNSEVVHPEGTWQSRGVGYNQLSGSVSIICRNFVPANHHTHSYTS